MSKTLIYLIAIFVLWMYFKFSSSANDKTLAEKYTVEDFDKAQSGTGGTLTSNRGPFTPGGGFGSDDKVGSGLTGKV